MEEVDQHAGGAVALQGIGLAIFVTSVVLASVSAIVVSLRVYVRWFEASIWWDDGLMFAGLVLYVVDVSFACTSTVYGLGAVDTDLTELLEVEGKKYLTIWSFFYAACVLSVKTSICMTMFRLAQTMRYLRFCVYILLAISIASFCVTFVGGLTLCRPVAAIWDTRLIADGEAMCAPRFAILGISYTTAAATMATDVACAILPAVILWKTQLELKTKILVSLLLSFGSFASICTIIRMPYVRYYMDEHDELYWIANIVLCSNVETAIGLIAGSVPILQKLIMRRRRAKSQAQDTLGQSPNVPGLVTFGNSPMAKSTRGGKINNSHNIRAGFRNPTDTGFSIAIVQAGEPRWPQDCWESLGDESSTRGIRADYTYEVELSEGPACCSSTESREW
ncbi:hypothetical protein AAE478_010181 [Parahypoxylon ruwenzoriense]